MHECTQVRACGTQDSTDVSRAGLTCLGFPKMILIPDFLQKNEVGEEYSYMFQGLIQQLKASVDFSWMLASALHKRKEM